MNNDIQMVMVLHDKKSTNQAQQYVKYLAVGTIVQDRFTGFVYESIGKESSTEQWVQDDENIDDKSTEDDEQLGQLWEEMYTFLKHHSIGHNCVGDYVYEGSTPLENMEMVVGATIASKLQKEPNPLQKEPNPIFIMQEVLDEVDASGGISEVRRDYLLTQGVPSFRKEEHERVEEWFLGLPLNIGIHYDKDIVEMMEKNNLSQERDYETIALFNRLRAEVYISLFRLCTPSV